ncbi:MAG: hypothetical protein M1819_006154 [Sarea resinae]|nr:MAG: hypothetical protein M1819_006154 [Sarea resinae]
MTLPVVALLGTCDTKLQELLYLRTRLLFTKCIVILIDTGRTPSSDPAINISQPELLSRHAPSSLQLSPNDVGSLSRGDLIKHLAACATACVRELYAAGKIHGIISIGGSGGTSLASAVMRDALPMGFPKLIVSTMASGDVRPFVGEIDLTMMYSVVDIAGSNTILDSILANAAGAMGGMAYAYKARMRDAEERSERDVAGSKKKRIAITMFGVTTPCVDYIRRHLDAHGNYEIYVFHATGAGGRAMERLISERRIDAVLDVTTTEIADEVVGGVLSAGPDRLNAAGKARIPQIVVLGALDMVNFGPRDTVPEKFRERNLYEHNPSVTLLRTNEDECERIGEFIATKLKTGLGPNTTEIWVPEGGMSMLSTRTGAFYHPEADEALVKALVEGLRDTGIAIQRDKRDINDEGFATDLAERIIALTDSKPIDTNN